MLPRITRKALALLSDEAVSRMKVVKPALRQARPEDGEAILAIYNDAIRRGEIAHHSHQLTLDELASMLPPLDDRYRTYVVEDEGALRGWAAFRPWHQRAAYAATLELLVYVATSHRGRGLATALVSQTIASASRAGFRSILALALADDRVAARLSRSTGFFVAGALSEVCPEGEALRDVTLYQRLLGSNEAT
jgi:L-amino acid N-acyltransferase YncA